MPTEMRVWEISQGRLVPIGDVPFEMDHLEKDLESLIEKSPDILGDDLLVIARQLKSASGIIDLLCIDRTSTIVIVELKRDATPREAVAQALDYASWLDSTDEALIHESAERYLGKPLAEAFRERFEIEMEDLDCQRHRIVVAAPRLDPSAERIINYLASYEIGINAVFFKYAQLNNGAKILARSVLVAEDLGGQRGKKLSRRPVPDLIALAKDRDIELILQVCRRVSSFWNEGMSTAYGGSFLYSLTTQVGWRSLFGLFEGNTCRST